MGGRWNPESARYRGAQVVYRVMGEENEEV
jgi:hypothetical protein